VKLQLSSRLVVDVADAVGPAFSAGCARLCMNAVKNNICNHFMDALRSFECFRRDLDYSQ
jgi:hypothetical protein